MTLQGTTLPLPGIYPHIIKIIPANKARGKDYMGLGHTEHDEQFVLKPGGRVGTAEFIGAGLCHVVGIPYCQPTVVTIEPIGRPAQREVVFGSRVESGIKEFSHESIDDWKAVASQCSNLGAFSAVLAIDLALGNDDRHFGNWMVQPGNRLDGSGAALRLRALDFSRAWPVDHPPQHPHQHRSATTWGCMRDWPLIGVPFVQSAFDNACKQIGALPSRWLAGILAPLVGVYLKQDDADILCQWWDDHWHAQVKRASDALNNGART